VIYDMAFGKKKKPTTDDAKKTKLPSGSKVRSTQETADAAMKKAVEKINRTEEFKKKTVTVYSADFSTIDDTVEDIKKEIRKQGVSDYACKGIYIILQDALKKIKLSQN
jgi:L-lactate utilization protein LutB